MIEWERCLIDPVQTPGRIDLSLRGGHDGLGIDVRHVGETADVLGLGGVEGNDESEHRPVPDIDRLDAEAAQFGQGALQPGLIPGLDDVPRTAVLRSLRRWCRSQIARWGGGDRTCGRCCEDQRRDHTASCSDKSPSCCASHAEPLLAA